MHNKGGLHPAHTQATCVSCSLRNETNRHEVVKVHTIHASTMHVKMKHVNITLASITHHSHPAAVQGALSSGDGNKIHAGGETAR